MSTVSSPVISFRPPDETLHMKLEQLRSTFPKQQWAETFKWLFEQEEVTDVIRARVTGS